jgi:hypothetical protein
MINTLKRDKSPNAVSVDNSRRSFFLKLGAGVSTALASTAVMAGAASGDADDSAVRVALLEEEKALRKLHQAFERAMDKGLYDGVIEMFADDARVIFNGGVFEHRTQGVSRLYRGRFRSGKTGKRMEPAPGFELDADQQQDSVEVSADRLSAKAAFPYSIQVGRPIETETSLAGMARLHGEGVQTWWEGGMYHVSYRKDARDGRWRISKLEYDTLSRADYRPGRTYAMPIAVSPISTSYPEDPQGPDALVRAS